MLDITIRANEEGGFDVICGDRLNDRLTFDEMLGTIACMTIPLNKAGTTLFPTKPIVTEPKVNWSAMPAWAKWVAMDEDGDWFWFSEMPNTDEGQWQHQSGCCGIIPAQGVPNFTGGWKDSLVERPKRS